MSLGNSEQVEPKSRQAEGDPASLRGHHVETEGEAKGTETAQAERIRLVLEGEPDPLTDSVENYRAELNGAIPPSFDRTMWLYENNQDITLSPEDDRAFERLSELYLMREKLTEIENKYDFEKAENAEFLRQTKDKCSELLADLDPADLNKYKGTTMGLIDVQLREYEEFLDNNVAGKTLELFLRTRKQKIERKPERMVTYSSVEVQESVDPDEKTKVSAELASLMVGYLEKADSEMNIAEFLEVSDTYRELTEVVIEETGLKKIIDRLIAGTFDNAVELRAMNSELLQLENRRLALKTAVIAEYVNQAMERDADLLRKETGVEPIGVGIDTEVDVPETTVRQESPVLTALKTREMILREEVGDVVTGLKRKYPIRRQIAKVSRVLSWFGKKK
jgi:hypothetical protein